jgi:aryl-alcohol dehydrogenase-like predicted oxidoreductase
MLKEKELHPVEGSSSITWLWIGTWSMGGEGFGPHDERVSIQVLKEAIENGITHFDTAGFYAHGRSEALLGRVIRKRRESFFISTKGGLLWKGRRVLHDARPETLRSQLMESLQRLKTDYIDLYQLHWPDPAVPIGESIDALKRLKEEGLIRYWGVGNLTVEQLSKELSKERNIPHQVHFNPIHRDFAVLEAGRRSCINCIVSPLEQGLLSNSPVSKGVSALTKRDHRRKNLYFHDSRVLQWVKRLKELSEETGFSLVHAVLLWIGSREAVNTIVPGPRRPEQLRELLRLLKIVEYTSLESDDDTNSIFSETSVKGVIPEEMWNHICKGPEGVSI